VSDTRPRSNRSATVAGIARHGKLKKSNPAVTIIKFVAAALAVVLVSGASVAAITVNQLNTNIKSVALVGETEGPPPDLGSFDGGFNILIVGSDTREGQGAYAGKSGSVLNDVNMLVHVSEDQTNATAVSFPRDLVVPIPSCPKTDGKGNTAAMAGQPINVTLFYGGLACTVLTVEKLTGLDIPFAGLITFEGVIQMSTAVGGVPVCVNGPLKDKYTGIDLPAAGTYNLSGFQALAFLRSRHGVGDGSDLGRISSQQVYLSSLVRTIKSDETLGDFTKLYGLAQSATQNITLSNSLKNVNTMVSMALVLKDIPLEKITFVQYPSTTGVGGIYSGKVAPLAVPAAALMAKLAADQPFVINSGTGRGSVADPNAPAATVAPATPAPSGSAVATAPPVEEAPAEAIPGVLGQTAADYTCSKVNN